MTKPRKDIKHCPKCGETYEVFCLRCRKRHRLERTEAEMERCGLTEETLIKILADHVKDGNFPALAKAIDIMDMKPSNKTEVSGPDGEPLIDAAKQRLLSKIASIAKREGSD